MSEIESNKPTSTELIKVSKEGRITAKELFEFLEQRPKDFSRWCSRNILKNTFAEENIDWIINRRPAENSSAGRPSIDYLLSVNLAKKICMQSPTLKGNQARNYFIEVERLLKEKIETEKVISSTPSDYQLMMAKSSLMASEASLMTAKVTLADRIHTLLDNHPSLSGVSKNLIACEEFSILSGGKLLPLPEVEKHYSATDIGIEAGVSSIAIGKVANDHNLKTSEYSIRVLDKSRSSDKQVETFRYNERGRQKLLNYIRIARNNH